MVERGDAYAEAGGLGGDAKLESNVIGFLARLGRGEFGLTKTYWFGWVLSDIAWLASAAIVALIVRFAGNLAITLALAVLAALYLAYNMLVMVGVWRAADAYGGWRGWAVLAKFNVGVVGFGLIGVAGVFLLRLLLG